MILSITIYITICFLIKWSAEKAMVLCLIWYPTIYLFRLGSINLFAIIVLTLLVAQYHKLKKIERPFPLKLGVIICIISYFLSNFFTISGQHNGILINILCFYGFTVILWKTYSGSREINKYFTSHLLIYLVVLILFAVLEMLTGKNFVIDYLNEIGAIEFIPLEDNERYGILKPQSLTIWSEVFGMICGLGFSSILIAAHKKIIGLNGGINTILACLFLFVVFCGSRAVLVGSMICIAAGAVYYMRKMKYIIWTLLFLFILILVKGDYLGQVVDGILYHEKSGGSSFEMRELQLGTSIYYFLQSPYIGNGLMYIYTTVMEMDKSNIYGAESILFEVLVDRGALGIISIVLLIMQTIYFLFKSDVKNLSFVVLGFIFAKVMTLMAGLEEMFFLYYVIPLYYIQKNGGYLKIEFSNDRRKCCDCLYEQSE